MIIDIKLRENSYDILLKRKALEDISRHININRKVLVVTDDGVPSVYAKKVASSAKKACIAVVPHGEKNKNFDNYKVLLKKMVDEGFTRGDCVAAVGGGVIGDMAGFAAASYMRGIDFYNIPTTLLSQVDSSIGGKVAIDFEGFKNIVGAFYQPKKVVIDPDVLKTLEPRQLSNGLAEVIKMAMIRDEELFEIIEQKDIYENIDCIIARSLNIKKNVVQQDEKESGLRKILNFGHTIGHGIESEQNGKLLHGESIALGMLPMCSCEARKRLIAVLNKVKLPCRVSFGKEKVFEAIKHDKKFSGEKIDIIKVNSIGSCFMENVDAQEVYKLMSALEEMQ